jgi:hypothetical protein
VGAINLDVLVCRKGVLAVLACFVLSNNKDPSLVLGSLLFANCAAWIGPFATTSTPHEPVVFSNVYDPDTPTARFRVDQLVLAPGCIPVPA